MAHAKRLKAARVGIDRTKLYPLTEAIAMVKSRANAKFDWANTVMPYYPDQAGAPQNSIIGGASSMLRHACPVKAAPRTPSRGRA